MVLMLLSTYHVTQWHELLFNNDTYLYKYIIVTTQKSKYIMVPIESNHKTYYSILHLNKLHNSNYRDLRIGIYLQLHYNILIIMNKKKTMFYRT